MQPAPKNLLSDLQPASDLFVSPATGRLPGPVSGTPASLKIIHRSIFVCNAIVPKLTWGANVIADRGCVER